MRSIRTLIVPVVLLAALAACGSDGGGSGDGASERSSASSATRPTDATVPEGAVTATIRTDLGDIVVALDTANAPKASARFVELAQSGFYDGLTFHRAVPDFVIQGGDPKGDGTGGTDRSVQGEVPDRYRIGSVAAAKTGSDPPGTFDCQFFIVTGPAGERLPPEYASFGTVTSGLDVAQRIEALAPARGDGPPTRKVTIESVTIS